MTDWTADTDYKTCDIVTYQGITYKCITGHTSQSNWTPPTVPALWSIYVETEQSTPPAVETA